MTDFRRFIVEEYPTTDCQPSKDEIAKAQAYIDTIEKCIDKAGAKYKHGDKVFSIVDSYQEEAAAWSAPKDRTGTLRPNWTKVYGVVQGQFSQCIIKVFEYKELKPASLEALKVVLKDSGLLLKVMDPSQDEDLYYHGIVATVSAE